MMGAKQESQAALFYEFSLEDHAPQDHLLRSIDRLADLSSIREHLAGFYSHTGRPSVDPALLIRMLLVGYCFGIRSERRLCEEVHLNLAYCWFCRLDLNDRIPDHSTFSKNRHGPFRESELLRHLFETTVARCIEESLVSGQRMASDASLIDTDHGVIVDVEATRSIRQAEVGSTKTMLRRVKERFDLHPERLIADTAYGTGPMLGWLMDRKIAPHIPVFDKSGRNDGTWTRAVSPELLGSEPRADRQGSRAIPRSEADLSGLSIQSQMLPERRCAPDRPRHW